MALVWSSWRLEVEVEDVQRGGHCDAGERLMRVSLCKFARRRRSPEATGRCGEESSENERITYGPCLFLLGFCKSDLNCRRRRRHRCCRILCVALEKSRGKVLIPLHAETLTPLGGARS